MKNYSTTLNQSQSQQNPILGRTDMVKNNAGGYTFKITPEQQLVRFLLCGTENGSYYATESKLTEDNAKTIIQIIQAEETKVLTILQEYKNRVPKIDTVLFVLALACTHGSPNVKRSAYNLVESMCKTATHLFIFVSNVNQMRGWSSGLRKAVSRWYENKNESQLAYQLVKYRNRAGFNHRDVLRLAHPKAKNDDQNALFKYAVGKYNIGTVDGVQSIEKIGSVGDLVTAFEMAQKTTDIEALINIISKNKLTWEMVPTEMLNDPKVLTVLLENMPIQATIRNLNRFAKVSLTTGNTEVTKAIKGKFTPEAIQKSNIHPVNLVNQMLTYSKGRGDKGNSTWEVNQSIVDALQHSYYNLVESIKPTNKNILIALDVSGSMNSQVGGTQLNASQLGALLAVTQLKIEPNAELIGFDTQLQTINIGARTSLDEVLRSNFIKGGTDCAVPIQYALNTKRNFDAIIILTDSETWAGKTHALTALNEYRRKINSNVKVIEIAMVANPHTILPEDPNVLRIVGFDSSVPTLINEFLS